jgi:hypothetical protein
LQRASWKVLVRAKRWRKRREKAPSEEHKLEKPIDSKASSVCVNCRIRISAMHKLERSAPSLVNSFWPFIKSQIKSVEARRFTPVFVTESLINNGVEGIQVQPHKMRSQVLFPFTVSHL